MGFKKRISRTQHQEMTKFLDINVVISNLLQFFKQILKCISDENPKCLPKPINAIVDCFNNFFMDSCRLKIQLVILAFLHLDFKIPNSSNSQNARLNRKPNIYLNILLREQDKRVICMLVRDCKVIVMIAPITITTRGQTKKMFFIVF
jgi:hypothetical protein